MQQKGTHTSLSIVSINDNKIYNNNNNDFLCANLLENQAQWLDKTNRNRKQCASRQRMDEGVRKLRMIGSIKAICFYTPAE